MMFNGFIDFYIDYKDADEGRIRKIIPISVIKQITVFEDGDTWVELEDETYVLNPHLGQQVIDTLCKQGLVLTVDQTNEPYPLEGELVPKWKYGVRFRKEAE